MVPLFVTRTGNFGNFFLFMWPVPQNALALGILVGLSFPTPSPRASSLHCEQHPDSSCQSLHAVRVSSKLASLIDLEQNSLSVRWASLASDLEQLHSPPSTTAWCLKEIHQHFTLLGGDAWSLNGILSGEIRPLLSCATFPFKILLITQTLNNYTDSCILLHQNDKAFTLAPHFTLLMKNSKLLRPPSIKREKNSFRVMTGARQCRQEFFLFKYVGCC